MASYFIIKAGLPTLNIGEEIVPNVYVISAGFPSEDKVDNSGGSIRFLSDGTFVREDQSTTVFVRHGFLVQQAGGEPPADPLLTQFSFRFRKDDGSESTATWEAAENTPISLAPNTKIRLRIGIDATNDPPSKDFQIEYRHKPSGGVFSSWEKVT